MSMAAFSRSEDLFGRNSLLTLADFNHRVPTPLPLSPPQDPVFPIRPKMETMVENLIHLVTSIASNQSSNQSDSSTRLSRLEDMMASLATMFASSQSERGTQLSNLEDMIQSQSTMMASYQDNLGAIHQSLEHHRREDTDKMIDASEDGLRLIKIRLAEIDDKLRLVSDAVETHAKILGKFPKKFAGAWKMRGALFSVNLEKRFYF
jgi:hypothetical protein